MYSTCLFCHGQFGRNESVEHFPIGRRLAFDAAKGRLWVVCELCQRWSLSPLDERWEAIEECEKLYRDTRRRVSTDNVGLARVGDGLGLVRIGDPLRPEMAAWRYGDQFGQRYRRRLVMAGATVAGGLAVASGPIFALGAAGAFLAYGASIALNGALRPLKVPVNSGTVRLYANHLSSVAIHFDLNEQWSLEIPHRRSLLERVANGGVEIADSNTLLRGEAALRAARVIFPRINGDGGSARIVGSAVSALEEVSDADRLLALVGRRERVSSVRWSRRDPGEGQILRDLQPALRLAIEMALHEDDERRAMEGELAALRDRWEEAEEIAAISDALFAPALPLPRQQ